MIAETTFVAVLAVIIVACGGYLGHFSAEPFTPAAATTGFSGISLGIIFAFLSIAQHYIGGFAVLVAITGCTGLHGVIPVAGIAIDACILYKSFFVSELGLPFKPGSSIVWFPLAWAVIGVIWAVRWRMRRPLAGLSLAESTE